MVRLQQIDLQRECVCVRLFLSSAIYEYIDNDVCVRTHTDNVCENICVVRSIEALTMNVFICSDMCACVCGIKQR